MLQLHVDAKSGGETGFVLELVYGGVFGLVNIPPDSLQALLLIECPRLLFPFARRIIADTTRDGGFPPLMLDPIDFVSLYRRRQQQAEAQAQSKAAASRCPTRSSATARTADRGAYSARATRSGAAGGCPTPSAGRTSSTASTMR